MTGPTSRIVLLALISAAGVVGMLVAQGARDWLFFALAALPLLLGAAMVAWRSGRRSATRRDAR